MDVRQVQTVLLLALEGWNVAPFISAALSGCLRIGIVASEQFEQVDGDLLFLSL